MSLEIIYGTSGSGKTAMCYEIIKQMAVDGEKILVLTPEHISLQTERQIASMTEFDGKSQVEVFGFGRLASKVFSKVGPVLAHFADEGTKSLIIKQLLIRNEKELTVLKEISQDDGFARCILDTINSLKSSCITPEDLRNIAKSSNKMLVKLKLMDIALIYEKYTYEFNSALYDSADNLTRLSEKIEKFKLFMNYNVFIDGFNGFSTAQYEVISRLMINAKKMVVTIPTDTVEKSDTSMFFRGINMADKLFGIAYDTKTEVLPNVYLKKCLKYANNKELLYLEKNLYRYPTEKYEKQTENIKLFVAENYYSEVNKAATLINELCREHGYRYKDIALVFRNSSVYLPIVKKEFSDYNIPLFANENASILSHPFIMELLSSFDVIINKFSAKSVIAWLKSDFHGFQKSIVYLIENYIIASGSNEKMWQNSLKYNGGMNDDDFQAVAINSKNALKSILDFSLMLKGRKTVKSISMAFKKLIENEKCAEYIIDKYKELNDMKELQKAEQYVLVYNKLTDVVSQMVLIFDNMPITVEKYLAILKSGLAGCDLGQIPASTDCVTVSEIDLFKENKSVIFVLGANEGVFPKGYLNEGLLSDMDKKLISEAGFDSPDNSLFKHKAEKYLVYTTLTLPSEKLFVSYSKADFEGNTLEVSEVIGQLKRIFPNLFVTYGEYENKNSIDNVDCVTPVFNKLISDEFKENSEIINKWYIKNRPELYDIIVRSSQYSNNPQKLRRDVIDGLYGATPYYSISKIEQYNRCSFAYFIGYGLSAKPRKENTVKPVDTGSIMHEIIEKYTLEASKIGFNCITLQECEDMTNKLTSSVMSSFLSENFFESKAGKTALKKISNILKGVLWNITEFYKKSTYKLFGCEVEFGGKNGEFPSIRIELDNGIVALLTGKIDRVDVLKTEKAYYVNVVDYKSSDKTIDYAQALFGLQIQLPVYIDAICDFLAHKNKVTTVPAAMLYCKIDYSPISGSRDYTEEKILQEIRNSLKMKGLIIDSVDVENGMDGTFAVKPDVTINQVETMCKNAYKKINSTIKAIMSGNIDINPVSICGKKTCEYCDFYSICSFDPVFGNNFKNIGKIKKEEYFEYVGKMDGKSDKSN